MKKQYRYKIQRWDICPYLKIYNDMGFNPPEKRKTHGLYTEASISTAECRCVKSWCYKGNRKCIEAKTRI